MSRRNILLSLLMLASVAGILSVGCEQSSDLLTPVSTTDLYLQAARLPDLPDGMAYELWLSKNGDDAKYTSVGLFRYDNMFGRFLKAGDGDTARADSNKFTIEDDILSFDSIHVSVEAFPGTEDPMNPGPGPIMLADAVSDPNDEPMELLFPANDSLYESIVEYSMESTSDEDDQLGMNGLESVTDGAAIWFGEYDELEGSVLDTFSLDSFSLTFDTLELNQDTTLYPIIDLVNIQNNLQREIIFGLDTFVQITTSYERVLDTITEPPWLVSRIQLFYTIADTSAILRFQYDRFQQPLFDLPNQTSRGWKYRGWVVSPMDGAVDASTGEMNLPPWRDRIIDELLAGTDGGLLTTGSFGDVYGPDDGNPYIDMVNNRLRVPPIPGEDFLYNLPNGAAGPVHLVGGSANQGTVFITLEPDNWIYEGETNFPLFVMTDKLPTSRGSVVSTRQIFVMWNRTQANDPAIGFPAVSVQISRF